MLSWTNTVLRQIEELETVCSTRAKQIADLQQQVIDKNFHLIHQQKMISEQDLAMHEKMLSLNNPLSDLLEGMSHSRGWTHTPHNTTTLSKHNEVNMIAADKAPAPVQSLQKLASQTYPTANYTPSNHIQYTIQYLSFVNETRSLIKVLMGLLLPVFPIL